MEFYEIIRDLRECRELKMTQTDLAAILMTSQGKISRLETGVEDPSLVDLLLLCRFYHVSADYLLGLGEGMPYPQRQG